MYRLFKVVFLGASLLLAVTGCLNDSDSSSIPGNASSSSSSSSSSSGSSSSSSSSSTTSSSGGLVSQHGQLRIERGTLVSANGDPVQLRGMSSLGLQWTHDAAPWMNRDSIEWLRDDWNTNVIRAAMYTLEGGYIIDQSVANKVWEIVDAAIALDMYAVVDWHTLSDCNPQTYQIDAIEFFEDVATRYGDTPNIIYEITNEPNPSCGTVTWSGNVKPYAEALIPAIRAIDPDSLIIVGTPTWSQDVDAAANDPLTYSNVAYGFHFYACSHGQSFRTRISTALSQGAAIFSTEWGTTDYTGNGQVCTAESDVWLDFFDQNNISWINWSLSVRTESSAALNPGASTTGPWSDSDLTPSGTYVRDRLRCHYGELPGCQ